MNAAHFIADLAPEHPVGAAVGLAVAAAGTLAGTLHASLPMSSSIPWANVVLFVGGICVALAGIGYFIKSTGKGVVFAVRAADGFGDLLGDPHATPPVPPLADRVHVLEEGQAEILVLLRGLHAKVDGTE